VNYYGKSKLAAELLVQISNLSWTIIRTVLVYGTFQNSSRTNLVLWVKNALEKKQAINVADDQFRMPTLAEDLASACATAALKEKNGVYHVSGKEMMSIFEMGKRVADFFGLDASLMTPVLTKSLREKAARPRKTGFIIDKAKKDLGYAPHSFEEGLNLIKKQLSPEQQVKSS
jgi:dTDP-4-dehydrorhamnose reductase